MKLTISAPFLFRKTSVKEFFRILLKCRKLLGVLILVLLVYTSKAQQDPMYTQYMFNTQTINPAYAGTWDAMGFVSLVRQQWAGWSGAPQTYTLSFQTPLRSESVALGLNVIGDKVGREKRLSVFGDYSYKLRVDEDTDLRFGLKAGFTNYSNNLFEYVLYPDDLVDPLFQGEIDSKYMPNLGVGLFLHNPRYYVGLSIPKIVHNEFVDNYNNLSTQSELRHYFLIAGVVVDMGEHVKFKPTFLTKAIAGAPLEVDLSANFLLGEKVWLGAMYRTGDSFGFIAQWIFNQKLRVGYAVDFTTTKLRNYHNGTHELMISYEMKFIRKRFESPRYF